jgi:SM-20-related protein
MTGSAFFARLGLLVISDFLDTHLCAKLRAEMSSVEHTPSIIVEGETCAEKLNEEVRKTKQAEVSGSTLSSMRARLLSLKPRLEDHFNLALTSCEEPQFLVYKQGDFFHAHQDKSDNPNKPDYVKKRRLSVLVFLNAQTRELEWESYCGGELIIYGLIQDPSWQNRGFSLEGKEGLMIVFPSQLFHEVGMITNGKRYSIVSWFF